MFRFILIAALAVAGPLAAEDARLSRTVLQEKPLTGADEMVVVVSKLVIEPGGRVPLHSHPGDEHAVVIRGGQVLLPDGKEVPFADGMALFFEAGSVHGGVTNAGDTPIELVTTHVVLANEPFQSLAE